MNSTNDLNDRLYYLDAVRAFALILGIFFHASLSFIPIFIGWPVMDVSTSLSVAVFVLISHAFRMELFFLLAGYFAHRAVNQKGAWEFVKSRLVRIGLPFLLGWLLIRPLLVSGWIMGSQSLQGDVDIINGLIQGYRSLQEMPKDLLTGTHLWFLYYLLIISFTVIAIRYLLKLNQNLNCKCTIFFDAITARLCSTLGILIMAFPTALCLWFMNGWSMETPDKSLIPNAPVTMVYLGFFVFGWLIQRRPKNITDFAKLTPFRFILCIIAIVITVILSSFEAKTGHEHYSELKMAFAISYAIMMWLLVAISVGLCKKLFNIKNKLVQYLADASYWMYLIHLPIVVWLQITVAELAWHWSIKLIGVSGVTISLSLLIYELCIRSSFIGGVLNGRKKPRVLFS